MRYVFPDRDDRRRAELSPRQEECVYLYHDERHTQFEVAGILGISQQAVQKHLQRARQRLEGGRGPDDALSLNGLDEGAIVAMV